MMICILEADDYSPHALAQYRQHGELILGEPTAQQKRHINVLVVRLGVSLTVKFLQSFAQLHTVISPTTALDHIDIKHCQEHSIQVLSLRDCMDQMSKITSTSEFTIALMLALLRFIPQAHQHVTSQKLWQREYFKSRQTQGLTLGLVGLGRIGQHVATVAKALGMRCIASDPNLSEVQFKQQDCRSVSLNSLCEQADIISIHATFNEANTHLIDAKHIQLMKSEALIINTSRGTLLNEHAAVNALQANKLGGIASDVLQDESQIDSDFLLKSPLYQAAKEGLNVILTPHIAGCTLDAMQQTEDIMAEYFSHQVAHG